MPGRGYRHNLLEVEDADNRHLQAVTYMAQGNEVDGKPSLRYITLLRDGARAHGLPEAYIRFLENVEPAQWTNRPRDLRAEATKSKGRVGWLGSKPLPISAFRSATSSQARGSTPRSSAAGIYRLCRRPDGVSRRGRHLSDPGEARPADQSGADDHGGVHHSFAVAHGEYNRQRSTICAPRVEITFEEDRQGGVLNGPRAYFTIPTAQCWSSSS